MIAGFKLRFKPGDLNDKEMFNFFDNCGNLDPRKSNLPRTAVQALINVPWFAKKRASDKEKINEEWSLCLNESSRTDEFEEAKKENEKLICLFFN